MPIVNLAQIRSGIDTTEFGAKAWVRIFKHDKEHLDRLWVCTPEALHHQEEGRVSLVQDIWR